MSSNDDWTNQVQSQVIVAGTTGGVFVYAPAPGPGNLKFSVTEATHDQFGNPTQAGFTAYLNSAGTEWIDLGGSGTLEFSNGTDVANIFLQSAPGNLVLNASRSLELAGELTPAQQVYPSGLTGAIPAIQVDGSTNAVGDTATAGDITTAWSVPAGDGVAGSSYVIRALATVTIGQTTAETLTIGADLNSGTLIPLATLGSSFNSSTLSATYDIPLELTLDVDAVTASTPQIYLSGPLGDTGANRLATNSANMSGHSNTATWVKSNANTLAIYAQWGGAGGSVQNIQTIKSKFYREGT